MIKQCCSTESQREIRAEKNVRFASFFYCQAVLICTITWLNRLKSRWDRLAGDPPQISRWLNIATVSSTEGIWQTEFFPSPNTRQGVKIKKLKQYWKRGSIAFVWSDFMKSSLISQFLPVLRLSTWAHERPWHRAQFAAENRVLPAILSPVFAGHINDLDNSIKPQRALSQRLVRGWSIEKMHV